jgi:hypothetical protein
MDVDKKFYVYHQLGNKVITIKTNTDIVISRCLLQQYFLPIELRHVVLQYYGKDVENCGFETQIYPILLRCVPFLSSFVRRTEELRPNKFTLTLDDDYDIRVTSSPNSWKVIILHPVLLKSLLK